MSLRATFLVLAAAALVHVAPAAAQDIDTFPPDITVNVPAEGRTDASGRPDLNAPAGSSVSVRVKRGKTTLAKGSGRAGKVVLKPSGAAARRLLHGRKQLSLHVFVTVKDGQGHVAHKDKVIVVRR
jgi:hypothetical protein